MHRTKVAFGALVSWFASACAASDRPAPPPVDCSVEDAYEFLNISNFNAVDPQWFQYADPTPGGVPNTMPIPDGGIPDAGPTDPAGSNLETQLIDPPRCGDTRALKLLMEGHNFWGGGFGDYGHNAKLSRADGTGYEGISFWARTAIHSERQFIFNVDDGRTIVLPPQLPTGPDGVVLPTACSPLAEAITGLDQDLDGDGCVGPGDIARETNCRLPPPESLAGDSACYNGGVDSPASGGVRVPEPDECGNAFHTRITTTATWQLFLIPWSDLVQWPCPNRLNGGINRADIAKFEIKLTQGTRYEIWLDNIAFYRARAD